MAPEIEGGAPEEWNIEPELPRGLSFFSDGSISGTPKELGDSNHTIIASNGGGSSSATIRIIVLHEAPMGLGYGGNNLQFSIGDEVQIIPSTSGGEIISWSVEPPLPTGLELFQTDGSIRGIPTIVHYPTVHRITASNSGGSIIVEVLIRVVGLPITNLQYSPWRYNLEVGDEVITTLLFPVALQKIGKSIRIYQLASHLTVQMAQYQGSLQKFPQTGKHGQSGQIIQRAHPQRFLN